jgi:hypothetical protein
MGFLLYFLLLSALPIGFLQIYNHLNPDNNFETIFKYSTSKEKYLVALGYNILYFYSLCEIRYNKIKRFLIPYLQWFWKSMLEFLKQNKLIEKVKIQLKDISIYDKNGNKLYLDFSLENNEINQLKNSFQINDYGLMIFSDKNEETGCLNIINYENVPESLNYEISNVSFVRVELFYKENSYLIDLKNEKHNYYIVNNILNQNFFKYYLKNILNVNIEEDNFDYKVTIIDQNINIIDLKPSQTLILNKNDYEIKEISKSINPNNIIPENLVNSEQNSSSDSEKSDDFIKLELPST